MPRQARVDILTNLAQELGAPVFAYVTGDRPGLETQVAQEQLRYLTRHLDVLGEQEALALLLYTRGGETFAAWPIINFVRARCQRLIALVPYSCHSCGTLMTLAADSILMTKYATLSPIDPSVANEFNPRDPANPQQRVQIAVEDVEAYFELARRHGVKDDERLAAAFERLAQEVHPLALGNVQRSIDQIRQLAAKLMATRQDAPTDDQAKEIINSLTTGLYTHYHMINRREATEIGLPVESPTQSVEQLLLDYYAGLQQDLELMQKFDPAALLRAAAGQAAAPGIQPQASQPLAPGQVPAQPAQAAVVPTLNVRLERAYIETTTTADAYVTTGVLTQQPAQQQAVQGLPIQMPGVLVPTLQVISEGWEALA